MTYVPGRTAVLANEAATGSSFPWPGGEGFFSVPAGTFAGATVKLQWQPDGTNWLDVTGITTVSFTAAGYGRFTLPPCNVRANVASGSPSGLYAYVQTVGG